MGPISYHTRLSNKSKQKIRREERGDRQRKGSAYQGAKPTSFRSKKTLPGTLYYHITISIDVTEKHTVVLGAMNCFFLFFKRRVSFVCMGGKKHCVRNEKITSLSLYAKKKRLSLCAKTKIPFSLCAKNKHRKRQNTYEVPGTHTELYIYKYILICLVFFRAWQFSFCFFRFSVWKNGKGETATTTKAPVLIFVSVLRLRLGLQG